jgi:hypothetical protein
MKVNPLNWKVRTRSDGSKDPMTWRADTIFGQFTAYRPMAYKGRFYAKVPAQIQRVINQDEVKRAFPNIVAVWSKQAKREYHWHQHYFPTLEAAKAECQRKWEQYLSLSKVSEIFTR